MTTISVRAKHIAKGKRQDCERCPIALAILDAIPGIDGIAVGPDEIAISSGELRLPFSAPDEVLNFVWAFDQDGADAVAPFSFDLDYPEVAA